MGELRGKSTRKLVIYASGDPLSNAWTVRAYDDMTDEHLWSSESASSLEQGLREVAVGIGALAAPFDGSTPASPASSGEKERDTA